MISLKKAQTILKTILADARERNLKPMAVAVFDSRGALKAYAGEDGSPIKRHEIAMGKAHGCLAMGVGSRTLNKMAIERPHFLAAASHAVGGSLIPVAGGVLIRDNKGEIMGAVGVSGDTSDNDELIAVAAITAAGFKADPGAN